MGGVAWERVEKAFSKELVVPKLTPHFADSNKILKTAVWMESATVDESSICITFEVPLGRRGMFLQTRGSTM
ncbi:hypothetical protein OPV22_010845 [Ensete ventricosum]|uniref:Uncharacterized protein n=1 Tax=Ensete ventricosum TaxID=4639 RepID=A0AAV8RM26_ENSVE|nr:hypothetical protein OPV22_010845 [Ensete ventricosum]